MEQRRIIRLWDHVGTGLIIQCPTGVCYSNQTGGTSCLQPEVEGAFVPIGNDVEADGKLWSVENSLFEYFEGEPHRGSGATGGLSEEDARFIENALTQNASLRHVHVDRELLTESHEAWVHVIIGMPEHRETYNVFQGFGPYPLAGILTWTNTD